MKKKLCAALLLFAALIGLLNIPAWATGSTTSVLASGKCGFSDAGEPTNDVTWTLERTEKDGLKVGLLIIRGAGAMYDYASPDDVPWSSYQDKIEKLEVTVESGVTSVGNNAFRNCAKLETVTLPEGLTKIGDVSFYHCDALKEIVIEEAAEGGANNALPVSLTEIGQNAFGYCALETVHIPAKVETIGESAFFKCSALTAITVAKENACFSAQDGVLFDKIAAPDSGEGGESGEADEGGESGESGEGEEETTLNASMLICYPMNKAGETYEIPSGIKTIAPYAFHSARSLKEVSASNGSLTEIGEWAFAYNSVLSTLTLPSGLTAVRDYAFYDCKGLSDKEGNEIEGATVTFEGSRQQWAAMEMGTGNYRLTNAKVIFIDMKQDNVVASGECGASGSNASWSLKQLDEAGEKHELVISGSGAMSDYGSEASVPWTHYRESGESGGGGEGEEGEGGGEGAAAQDLREKITSVRIEGKITNVGSYAFYNCDKLTTVTVETPSALKTIGAYAFSNCVELTTINLDEIVQKTGDEITGLNSIGDYAFSDCAALETVKFPESLKTIGKRAFLRSGLTSVTLPLSVEEVGEWAFRRCGELASLTMEPLPNAASAHYTAIGDYAFADCPKLGSLSFTDNLTVIGEYAFSKCDALTAVTIPVSVSGIGSCAFYACPALTGVVVDRENDFYCSTVYMKNEESGELQETETGMLLNKERTCIFFYPIGRISDACAIPETVSSVAAFAFDGVTNLTDVYYYGSPSDWKQISIGQRNDKLKFDESGHTADGAVTLHCEGEDIDPDNDTRIDSLMIEETEDGWTASVTIHCGEETLGAQALCAIYDADGRFLGIAPAKSAEDAEDAEDAQDAGLVPGEDNALAFTLSKEAASLRLFIVDGYALPCCPLETRELAAS